MFLAAHTHTYLLNTYSSGIHFLSPTCLLFAYAFNTHLITSCASRIAAVGVVSTNVIREEDAAPSDLTLREGSHAVQGQRKIPTSAFLLVIFPPPIRPFPIVGTICGFYATSLHRQHHCRRQVHAAPLATWPTAPS